MPALRFGVARALEEGTDLEAVVEAVKGDEGFESSVRGDREAEAAPLPGHDDAGVQGHRLEAHGTARPGMPAAVDDPDSANGHRVARGRVVFLDGEREVLPGQIGR